MMSKYTGKDGMKRFAQDFKKWAQEQVTVKLAKGLTDATTISLEESKMRCPVGSGDNRGELRRSLTMSEPKISGNVVRVLMGTDVEHGIYVEFGTDTIKVGSPNNPRTDWPAKHEGGVNEPERMPYMRSAIYAKRNEIVKALTEAMKK